MAKDQSQNEDQVDDIIDTTEDDTATATAVKTSEDFDKRIESEGIDESLSEDEDSKSDEDHDTDSDSKDTDEADDKDTGDADADETDEETGGDEDALSQNLVDQAFDLGLKMEEISLHTDDAGLEKTIAILSNIKARTPEPETQKPAKDDAQDKDDEGIKIENEDDIDPGILKAIRGIEKQNKDLRTMVERLTGTMQEKEQREFEAKLDGMFNALGTDYEDVFGAGSTKELSNRTAAFRNRTAMQKRMYAIASGYHATKMPMPSDQEIFDTALFALHRKKMNTVRGKKLTAANRKQKGKQAGVPASSKNAKPATGIQKAYQTSQKFDELIDTSE